MLTVVMLNIVMVGVVMLGIVTLSISIPNAACMLSVVIVIVGAPTPHIQATHTFQIYTTLTIEGTTVGEMSVVEVIISTIFAMEQHIFYIRIYCRGATEKLHK